MFIMIVLIINAVSLTSDFRMPANLSTVCSLASPFMPMTIVAVALMATRNAKPVAPSW